MGTNSKSSHASYAVSPSDAPASAEPSPPPPAEPDLSDELVTAKTDLMSAMDSLGTLAAGGAGVPGGASELPEDPLERYELFAAQIQAAREAIEKMQAEGAPDEEIQAQLSALRAQSLAYLTALDPEELRQIAAANGFEHPALVGLSAKGQHPLVHWLDPYYADDIPSKQKIQAAALKRYDQLVAGQTVGGMTLADLQQIEGTTGTPVVAPPGTWPATPEQITAAKQAWEAAAHEVAHAKGWLDSDKLRALLDAEKHILTANCPEVADLDASQHQIKIWTDDPLAVAKIGPSAVAPLVQDALASGEMSETEAYHLKPLELVALLRTGTPDTEKESLKAVAQGRKNQLIALDNALDVHTGGKQNAHTELTLPALAGDPGAVDQVAAWAKSTGELHQLQQEAQGWIHETVPGAVDIGSANPALLTSHTVDPKALTTEFKAWAKGQTVADLRKVAAQLGMPDTDKAARAHLQNYIAATFNPALSQEAINAKVQADAAKKQAAAAAKGPSAPLASDEAVAALKNALDTAGQSAAATPAGGGLSAESKVEAAIQMGASPEQAKQLAQAAAPAKPVPKAPVKPAAPGSFTAKVQALVAGLQHVKATAQDVPARIDADVVSSWDFGTGKPANLGGTYSKTLHTAPDGSSWLFKADSNGGVIARSEAAASHLLSLSGLPAVPVYVKEVGGKIGSVQPMLQGAAPFPADPKSWTQSQVDAIVRGHVGSWVIGDHDGHAQNVLMTASGGQVHIDRGQAFKHLGQDKLALGYAPSGGGSYDPLHHRLYTAALNGELADGVTINPAVAHPIIKNIEAIPDSQWRSILHSTAHEGAKAGDGVHWVPTMRKRAAKKHGIPSAKVTHEQIAQAFLDHAVERKKSLRQSFTNFFVKELKMAKAASLKHGAE